jgi:hypothetical protein
VLDRPHLTVTRDREGDGMPRSRRRRGLRPNFDHHRALRPKADPTVPRTRSNEHRGQLAGTHGGSVARLTGAGVPPAIAWREDRRPSNGRLRGPECTRKQGEKRSGKTRSTGRGSPASSAGTPASDSVTPLGVKHALVSKALSIYIIYMLSLHAI